VILWWSSTRGPYRCGNDSDERWTGSLRFSRGSQYGLDIYTDRTVTIRRSNGLYQCDIDDSTGEHGSADCRDSAQEAIDAALADIENRREGRYRRLALNFFSDTEAA
jgi:hypothetical protein